MAVGAGLLAVVVCDGQPQGGDKAVLVIHGGAGVRSKEKMTAALEKRYRADLELALREGHKALQKEGGTSLDAVEAAIKVLEDSPLFNAGKGAVFTREGRNELDASVMDGNSGKAGAVAGVTRVRNPIAAARAVMEKSPHVLLVGEGADRFALGKGVAEVSPTYFWTEERWQQLRDAQADQAKQGKGAAPRGAVSYFGTVGAVAVDRAGNLAAGTSTGGMTSKWPGRVGDSPLIGAGTYAENGACAVSGTGHGEVFIRHVVAHDIAARVKYKKLSVRQAADEVMNALPKEEGGVGGVIVIDREGNFATPFNTEGMYRGHITRDGKVQIAIYEK